MKLLKLLLRTSRRITFLAILTGALCGASTAGLVALINAILNSPTPTAASFIWLFVGLLGLMFSLTIWSQVLLARLAQSAVFDLRMYLSRRILAAPLRHLETLGAHRLLAVLTDDIADVSNAYTNLPTFCIQGAALLIGLIYLGWLSWTLLLTGLGVLILGALTYLFLTRHALHALQLAREKQDALFNHFRALTEGTKELKIHHQRRAAFLDDVLQSTAEASRHYTVEGMKIYAIARGWGNSLFFVLIGLLLFALPALQPIETPALRGAVLIVLYMISPLAIILNLLPVFGRATVALQKIETLGLSLTTSVIDSDALDAATPAVAWRTLELKDVTHSYHQEHTDSQFVLGPIELSFHPGELVFLVGGNGSGKTTLAKLLVGLYVPETGAIHLDGQPITDSTREAYRQLFAMVFSDFYLFEQLLGLVRPELDAQARDYLRQLQLDQKVQVVDGTLSTTALSQGQRKRLALLTAYLEDRPCYVFDEWAADQDPIFKDLFYTQLLPELKQRGKAVLVITHDDKYFHLADRLVKLDYGQVVHDGPADQSWSSVNKSAASAQLQPA